MKLRTGMLLGITFLVVALIGATVLAVVLVLDRTERRELREDLVRGQAVFTDLLASRQAALRSDCRVVSNEPRMRAVIATQDISRETVLGVISELRTSLGSDLFLLTDPSGTLVADTLDADAMGFDLSRLPAIEGAKTAGEGSGLWITEDRPYQVHACRVDFGSQPVGVIVIGRRFDDVVAERFHDQTGGTLLVALDGKQVAASSLAGKQRSTADLGAATTALGTQVVEVDLAGARYVALGGRFPGYDGARVLTYGVLRSLDEALAPGRRLTLSILLIAGIALAAALLLAAVLARRLARPVDTLVKFTQRVAEGQLDARATPSGATELKTLANAMNRMVVELDRSRGQLVVKQRLEREMEIANRLQTSILPRKLDVADLDIAAKMLPATDVGGDYYDVLPVAGGCWIGIGDVAGHGLTAGIEMLMVQSVVATLVHQAPEAAPHDHVSVLNAVLFENIRNRLQQDEHITLSLLRYTAGRVTFAGAHEEIIVCRAAGGACERIATPGTWVGARADIARMTIDSSFELAPGDLMVLYSDGITEARDTKGAQFGIDQVCALVEAGRGEPVGKIADRIIERVQAWQADTEDDLTVVVVRRAVAG